MQSSKDLPRIFNEIKGQKLAIELLISAISCGKLAPAYLFSGPNGVGRKLTAKCFLEGILSNNSSATNIRDRIENLNHPDLIWVEPTYLNSGQLITKSKADKDQFKSKSSPQIRLEQIRDLTKFLSKKPIEARLSLVVVESAEALTEASANALLKTLEEPLNGLLVLITDRSEKLLPTICSRCQVIPFTQLNSDDFQAVFQKEQFPEDIEAALTNGFDEKELLNLAGGSPGDFIKHVKNWNEMPKELLHKLHLLSSGDCIGILSLAKDITEQLDLEKQIWLITWLQQNLWIKNHNQNVLIRLEKLRLQLAAYVQPRLAWEIALLELTKNNN